MKNRFHRIFLITYFLLSNCFFATSQIQLVKDINQNTTGLYTSSAPERFFTYNNEMFFRASDSTHGFEIWKSDGTTSGTSMVKDIYPGNFPLDDSYQYYSPIIVVNNKIVFAAQDGVNGLCLWSSDGTNSGTNIISTFPTSAYLPDYVYNLTKLNDTVAIFAYGAAQGIWGVEDIIYRTNGTVAGTYPIDTVHEIFSLVPQTSFLVMDGEFYYSYKTAGQWGSDSIYWVKSNGTLNNQTVLFEELFNSSSISDSPFGIVNNHVLYFMAKRNSGFELYRTDGTPAGTYLLKDINPGANGSFPQDFFKIGGEVYFIANDGTHGKEIWMSDGTNAGTNMLVDLEPGSNSVFSYGYLSNNNPTGAYFTEYNNKVYFTGNEGVGVSSLFRTDGTVSGTEIFVHATAINDVFRTYATATYHDTLFFYGTINPGVINSLANLYYTDGVNYGPIPLGVDNARFSWGGSGGGYQPVMQVFQDKLFLNGLYDVSFGAGYDDELFVLDHSQILSAYYKDSDGDLFGNADSVLFASSQPAGYVSDSTDCDDLNIAINPSALEICGNNIDENCDGIIENIDLTVTANANTLTASQSNAVYQWIDCDNGNQNINGATNQSFTATADGNYAVIINKGNCADTSDCVLIASTNEVIENFQFRIYPNPSEGKFIVEFNSLQKKQTEIRIVDAIGHEIIKENLKGSFMNINLSNFSSGIYLIEIRNHDSIERRRLVLNH